MEARITYRNEIYIKGENIAEIKDKFESMNLDPVDKGKNGMTDFCFVEIVSVEDSQTYDDLMNDWDHAYDHE